MAASVVLQGFGELVKSSGGVVTLQADTTFGAPAVETAAVARLLLDGDVVSGRRSGNRVLTLPIVIPSTDPTVRATILDRLARAVDATSYTLTLTPSGGLPVVFDCFRGAMTRVFSTTDDAQGRTLVTLTIPALPFTRTPDAVTSTPSSATGVQIDALDNTTGLTANGTTTANTATKVEGTASIQSAVTSTLPTFSWARTVSSRNLTGMTVAAVWALTRTGTSMSGLTWSLTLSSSGGSSTWTATDSSGGGSSAFGAWRAIQFVLTNAPASTTGTGVNLAAVTGWTLAVPMTVINSTPFTQTVLVDDLHAYLGSAVITQGLSSAYTFVGVAGSARTPVGLTVACSAGVMGGVLIHRAPNPSPQFSPILPAVSGSTSGTVGEARIFDSSSNFLAGLAKTFVIPAYTVRKQPPTPSTYSVLLRGTPGTLPATVTVTAQLTSDPAAYTQTISRTYTSASDPDLLLAGSHTVYLMSIGELTLPPRDIDPANTAATITITVTTTGAGGGLFDVGWLLDVTGETILVQLPTAATATAFFVDPPGTDEFLGRVSYSPTGVRTDATNCAPWQSGAGVVNFDPGLDTLLVVPIPQRSQTAPSGITVVESHYPRYWAERAS